MRWFEKVQAGAAVAAFCPAARPSEQGPVRRRMRVPLPALVPLLFPAALVALAAPAGTPEEDRQTWQGYFRARFPRVPLAEFGNGTYALDPAGRENWEAIEDFPPYEPAIDRGEAMWHQPFANGTTYEDCFPEGPGVAGDFPHWDRENAMVVTLPLAINRCRELNGEEPLPYEKGPLADLLAYIAFKSRGQITAVAIPADDPGALDAYAKGRHFYFARRGKLNFSCADCHVEKAGERLRAQVVSPALGHATHFPVYRSEWGEMGTLHRRFADCNQEVRARPFPAQGEEYRDLEYFLTYMQNGLPLNGPGTRK